MSNRDFKTCDKCGSIRDVNATYCGNCGKPFDRPAAEENYPTISFGEVKQRPTSQTSGATIDAYTPHPQNQLQSHPQNQSQSRPQPLSNAKYLIGIAALVALLLGAGGFELGQIVKGSQQSNTPGTSHGGSGLSSAVTPGCPTSGGYYKITNVNSGLTLDVPGGTLDSNTSIQQLQFTGTAEQEWEFVLVTGGNFKIVNVNSSQVMDEPNSSLTVNTEIHQFPYNSGQNQQWQCVQAGNGSLKIINVNSGLVLDVPNTSMYAPLLQDKDGVGANQQWNVTPISSSAPGCPTTGANLTIVNANSHLALDVPNPAGYAPLLQDKNGAGWLFVQVNKGYFEIENPNNNMALEVPDSSLDSNTSILQLPYQGQKNQLWECVPVSNGFFKIVNANSDMVMDVSGGSLNIDAEIHQSIYNGGSSQQWKFV